MATSGRKQLLPAELFGLLAFYAGCMHGEMRRGFTACVWGEHPVAHPLPTPHPTHTCILFRHWQI